jgi:hypothetical protein
MIRRSLTLWLLLATCAGIALFLVKDETQAREERLAALQRRILETREEIRVLKAEWSYLNRLDYIEQLASSHLGLRQATRDQITTLDSLPWPLKPVDGEARPTVTSSTGSKLAAGPNGRTR